jgi:hypothetical protein
LIEIKIPKEIKEYHSKLFFGLNVRQCICSGIALAICVPLYVFGKKYISEDIVSWIVILIAVPLILIGFFQYNGMTFEVFAREWFDFNFGLQKRKYEYEPIFMEIRHSYMAEDLSEEIALRKKQIKLKKKQDRKNRFKKRR